MSSNPEESASAMNTDADSTSSSSKRSREEHDATVVPKKLPKGKEEKVEEDDEDLLLSSHQVWDRPPLAPTFSDRTTPLVFQEMDIDYSFEEPIPGMPGSRIGPVPVIRIFGCTDEGHSVMLAVHGYLPHFYTSCPPDFLPEHTVSFRQELNAQLTKKMDRKPFYQQYILDVRLEQKQSLFGYHGDEKMNVLRVTVAGPHCVPKCRKILEDGEFAVKGCTPRPWLTFESNIAFVLRYMVDSDMVGCQWLRINPGDYQLVPESRRVSKSQIEAVVAYDKIQTMEPVGEWGRTAPLRICSFDIECAGRRGIFPEPDTDPIIQIANLVTRQGENRPFVRNVFVLGSCSPIIGSDVRTFDTEQDLLRAWAQFVNEVDPDMFTGYNIENFDFWYIIQRAEKLRVREISFISRLRSTPIHLTEKTFQSNAYGKRVSRTANIYGRIKFDVLQIMQRDQKLSSYTLNHVSSTFLGQQKEDVHHSIISVLHNGTADDRRRLAVYCIKDAYLPQRLLDKLMCTINYIEMSRVTGVPFAYLLERGQQIKVLSQLYRRAQPDGLLIPTYKRQPPSSDVGYTGATVIQPIKGYYEKPISTLDFSSLYPSIMMAHNLCYCTLLHPEDAAKLPPDSYTKTPRGDYFVKASVKEGLLPRILRDLLAARSQAKADLKNETDPFKRAVLDGRQLALKVSANSVYGFTGATVGELPCLQISASVTAFGREMIEKTKRLVEERYTIKNGYSHDSVVIYGDTDSVMIKFGPEDLKTCMDLGKEAAEYVTENFIRPINLEFEKAYCPYLLISKKRYAGLYFTRPDKWDKIDTKGLETVRRDNCLLVRNVITDCLSKILVERDPQGAIAYTKSVIADLLCNRLDLSVLVISKSLSRKPEDYASKQPHTELTKRMTIRDPGTAPHVGDRVPYVFIRKAKGAAAYEKAEDPLYVLENNLPIDADYYLQNQLRKPLQRIFKPICDPSSLFAGEHTRTVYLPTPQSHGIAAFAVKREKCMGCKTALGKNDRVVCKDCKPLASQFYREKVSEFQQLEREFQRLWTQCQHCQGSLHQTVLCESRDCPIFYRRKKVQKDLNESTKTLARFNLSW